MHEHLKLEITDIQEGTGPEATKGALLICHYTGTLENGTVFDSSLNHGRPFEFVIGSGRVIKGWDQGLLGIRAGGRRKLFVPSYLAYGERTKPTIPAHSNLIFEVEMLEVRPRD